MWTCFSFTHVILKQAFQNIHLLSQKQVIIGLTKFVSTFPVWFSSSIMCLIIQLRNPNFCRNEECKVPAGNATLLVAAASLYWQHSLSVAENFLPTDDRAGAGVPDIHDLPFPPVLGRHRCALCLLYQWSHNSQHAPHTYSSDRLIR